MPTRALVMSAVVGLLVAAPLLAQTAPCGRAVVVASKDGKADEERFLPAPLEHVKASALRALPALGAKLEEKNAIVKTEDGVTLNAASDWSAFNESGLLNVWRYTNKTAGVKGRFAETALGKFVIQLRPGAEQGTAGTHVKISFRKVWRNRPNGATPLMEEIACLSGLLGTSDPLVNPRGPAQAAEPPSESGDLVLPEGTPVKVILRDPLYSKDVLKLKKEGQDIKIAFEVAADVTIDDVPVIRRGALAVGRLTDAKAPGSFGHSAVLTFVIEQVTATDGQSVVVTGAIEKQRNKDNADYGTAGGGLAGLLLSGWLTKGAGALVRAGTTYDVEVSQACTIKVGN